MTYQDGTIFEGFELLGPRGLASMLGPAQHVERDRDKRVEQLMLNLDDRGNLVDVIASRWDGMKFQDRHYRHLTIATLDRLQQLAHKDGLRVTFIFFGAPNKVGALFIRRSI